MTRINDKTCYGRLYHWWLWRHDRVPMWCVKCSEIPQGSPLS